MDIFSLQALKPRARPARMGADTEKPYTLWIVQSPACNALCVADTLEKALELYWESVIMETTDRGCLE